MPCPGPDCGPDSTWRPRCSRSATSQVLASSSASSGGSSWLRPDMGTLDGEIDALAGQVDAIRETNLSAFMLTVAELRLLPLLATHLTFPEIGERLFLSTNTIKTEAKSIYRKLNVASRGGAVERASEIGLLETWIRLGAASTAASQESAN